MEDSALLLAFIMRRFSSHVLICLAARQHAERTPSAAASVALPAKRIFVTYPLDPQRP
jgi:hypothetical protein